MHDRAHATAEPTAREPTPAFSPQMRHCATLPQGNHVHAVCSLVLLRLVTRLAGAVAPSSAASTLSKAHALAVSVKNRPLAPGERLSRSGAAGSDQLRAVEQTPAVRRFAPLRRPISFLRRTTRPAARPPETEPNAGLRRSPTPDFAGARA